MGVQKCSGEVNPQQAEAELGHSFWRPLLRVASFPGVLLLSLTPTVDTPGLSLQKE